MEPIIKAIDVQYCTLQCPDLDIQEQFLIHFGMHTVEKSEDTLLMRGAVSYTHLTLPTTRHV